jgi:hypothetical protein
LFFLSVPTIGLRQQGEENRDLLSEHNAENNVQSQKIVFYQVVMVEAQPVTPYN